MKQDKEVSKVTQVLINDLKGRRVVQHRFHEQNKKDFGEEEKETRKRRKKQWWRIPHAGWVISTGIIMLIFGVMTGATWESIFRGNKEETAPQIATSPKYQPQPREQKTVSYQQPQKVNYYPATSNYKQQQPKRQPKERNYDRHSSGIISYPAPKKKIPYAPPTIISYSVHLDNGKEIQCQRISKESDKALKTINGKEAIVVEKKFIAAIMQKTVKGSKIKTKYIKLDSL